MLLLLRVWNTDGCLSSLSRLLLGTIELFMLYNSYACGCFKHSLDLCMWNRRTHQLLLEKTVGYIPLSTLEQPGLPHGLLRYF